MDFTLEIFLFFALVFAFFILAKSVCSVVLLLYLHHNNSRKILSFGYTTSILEENDVCAICLDDSEHQVVCLLECKHAFHEACILSWLNENPTCPLCRVRIKAQNV